MTKRVVLIGHPVAHSLSGAMQQAAFDELGHRREVRAVGPPADRARRHDRRAARRRLPRRERHDPAQGAGRPAGRPADRGGPRDGRRQHDHARGQAAHRPQHGRARASRSRSTGSSASRRCRARRSSSGAGGGARAVVYGLITRGLPADRRLQPPPPPRRGPGPALRPERVAHGAARDAVARVGHRGGAGRRPRCSSTPRRSG